MFLSLFKGFQKMRKFSIAPAKVQNPPKTDEQRAEEDAENPPPQSEAPKANITVTDPQQEPNLETNKTEEPAQEGGQETEDVDLI